VAVTGAGGVRMGNPAARVKLIEYASLACPHCRHFHETGFDPLVQRYVRSGKVSYEYRNLLINGPDVSMAVLAHCAPTGQFFAFADRVYATQPQWQKRVQDASQSRGAELEAMTDQQRVLRYAQLGGFAQIAARFGVSPVRARQCLSDPKRVERLLAVVEKASEFGINRTPTFVINGKVSGAATWEDLEPQLKNALGGRG
jgi:protein-disulfide isomerase